MQKNMIGKKAFTSRKLTSFVLMLTMACSLTLVGCGEEETEIIVDSETQMEEQE